MYDETQLKIMDASFGDKLIGVSKREYIRNSIKVFVSGICGK